MHAVDSGSDNVLHVFSELKQSFYSFVQQNLSTH